MKPSHRPARFAVAFLSIFFLAAVASAQPKSFEYRYFKSNIQDIIAQIPSPPADDSVAGMADLETLLQLQKDRTPEQVERAKRVNTHTARNVMGMGAQAFGPWFSEKNLPRTAQILREINMERHYIGITVKNHWNRPRPFVRDPRIQPCLRRPGESSYPSGHTAASAAWAGVLAAAMPEYKEPLFEEVRETMWGRVLAGVHFPTDTIAGRKLGFLIADEMLKTQVTQDAVREMRAEILAFIKANPDVVTLPKQ
ncbi:acid phosphatase (class A) [Ereboglobus sp. PH5-10]|uniref:phosphatase PAP2 family protein n=1 Tax=Ereboglobus sp. PH5-10 TaxID=2940629 RepID=UPI002406B765|nr:phosphatase PAP2 family protein [Ereboglobus sp. PH5-10]MDF9826124.1 acid phosphatase (class A) [Ereboglobus sp. PH5-10]